MSDLSVTIESLQGLVLSPRRSGAAGSITIAAAFSILLPVVIGFLVAFNPPVHSLLRVRVDAVAGPEAPTLYQLDVSNLTSVAARDVRVALNDPNNSILAISTVGSSLEPSTLEMVTRIPTSEIAGATPELGVVIGLVPANTDVTLGLTLAKPKLGLAIVSVKGPSVAQVGPGLMDPYVSVYPNNLYWFLLVISLGFLGWVVCYYGWRASIAGFLNGILDNVEGQERIGTSIARTGQAIPAAGLLDEIYSDWLKERWPLNHPIVTQAARTLPEAVDRWGLGLRVAPNDLGRPPIYLVAPFHIVGHPTFSRWFRRNHVLALLLTADGNVTGHGWTRLGPLLDSGKIKLTPWGP